MYKKNSNNYMKRIARASANQIRLVSRFSRAAEGGKQ